MTAKKADGAEVPAGSPDVDMERIKKMMGPLPDELVTTDLKPEKPKKTKPSTAPEVKPKGKSIAVTDAAEETGEAGIPLVTAAENAEVTKMSDEPALTAEDNLAYVEALENDGKPPVKKPDDEGLAADDPVLEQAVDDIVTKEGDKVLEAEDEARGGTEKVKATKPGFKQKLKDFWAKPAAKWAVLGGVLALLIAAGLVPTSRYFVLNAAGARASLSVSVIDSGTLQPLKNVKVTAANVTVQTDQDGKAKLERLKLGPTDLVITKRAYAVLTEKVTVGWGSNPKGQLRLQPSGEQYGFVITDFLSGKPIEKAEAVSGDGNAVSDKEGRIVLTLDTSGNEDSDTLDVQITAAGYRTETVETTAGNKETRAIKLVPARKSVFVSKRSGKYDIYTIDIDGKNEKKIVSGTGIERDDLALVPQQNSDLAAFVATRENARNSDNFLLSTLYLVDTKSGTLTKVDQSEQIQLVGWSSSGRLVYVKIAAGASAANPKRHRIVSLHAKNSTDTKELASANYFNDVVMAGDRVLYAPSNAFADNPRPGLFSINADNTSPITVTDKEVFNIFRTDYETITVSYGGASYTYKIGSPASTLTATKTPTEVNRLYIDSITGSKALWIDTRDGKNLVLSYDRGAKKDTTLATKAGARLPAYWLNDQVIVFRVNDGRETADYAVSVNGGDAKKISDVTDSSGFGRWFYY